MLAKSVEKNGKEWDKYLPYVLFAYRSRLQQSTRESPFYLLYGRDPRLPTDEVLNILVDRRRSQGLQGRDDPPFFHCMATGSS